MKKSMTLIVRSTLAALLLSSGVVVASDSNHAGLTPRKSPSRSVVRAQQPSSQGLMPKAPVYGNAVEKMGLQPVHEQQPIEQPVLIEAVENAPVEAAPAETAPVTQVPAFDAPVAEPEPVVEPAVETPVMTEPVLAPQNVSAPAPSNHYVEPAVSEHDAYLYSEFDRLAAEVAALKSGAKKDNTKKSWGASKLSGQLFLDDYSIGQQDSDSGTLYGNIQNKAGIREMRLAVSGKGFESFDYKLELSLSPTTSKVDLVDNWIGANHVPLFGYVRAGHFKPETGLSYMTSAPQTTLTEFTGPSASFGLGRRFGVSSENLFADDHIRLFMGVFQEGATNSDRFLAKDNQGQVFNMRLSAAPMYAQDGRCAFHVGGHYSYVSPRDATTTMSAVIGSIGWLPMSISTGSFANNHHHRSGLELAYQAGPFAVQSEVYVSKYAGINGDEDRTANGAYVELKYFLTGDHRAYNLSKGVFEAVKVKRNFHPFQCGDFNLIDGWGAWQTVAQWSYLDLSDWRYSPTTDRGGIQNDVTLGLNWFWTPNIRWLFEYVHSEQKIGVARKHCSQDIFGTSLRVNF